MGLKKELKQLREMALDALEELGRMEPEKQLHFMKMLVDAMDCYHAHGPTGVMVTAKNHEIWIYSLNSDPTELLRLTSEAARILQTNYQAPPSELMN
jgi:hypothetical protein